MRLTQCGIFRNITTLFGITITDAWKGYCFHLSNDHCHKNMELLAFTKIVAKDMLNNKLSSTPEEDRARSILTKDADTSRTAEEIRTSALEALLQYATVEHSQIEDLSTITQSTLATPTITEEPARSKRNHELMNCTDFIAS